MGKSIRSKIKRKHRAEFRATIGTVRKIVRSNNLLLSMYFLLCIAHSSSKEAFNSNMEKVQANLQDSLEKQNVGDLSKLSSQLDTGATDMDQESNEVKVQIDAGETTETAGAKGENKVPTKKPRRKKFERPKKQKPKAERPRPRFFCQF